MSDEAQKKQLSKIKLSNMIYPILIGLGVVGYMIYKDFDINALSKVTFDINTFIWICVAMLLMAGRDIGYIIRLKVLVGNKVSWLEAFKVIMLWEFTSAITPSAIGGTSFAIIYVHKAGVGVGRSSAIVLLTSFLDELYFILMFPILLLLVGANDLFSIEGVAGNSFLSGVKTFFLVGYFLKLAYLLLVAYGLFINPRGLKWLIIKVFSLRPFRRWREPAVRAGSDMVECAKELKYKRIGYWAKLLSSTFLSWTSRYFVVNALILAFMPFNDHLLLFGRQLVIWVMMLVMPTPGGSGFTEYFFNEYLGQIIPIVGITAVLALLWRMITYYVYLLFGVIIFPRWLKQKFGKLK